MRKKWNLMAVMVLICSVFFTGMATDILAAEEKPTGKNLIIFSESFRPAAEQFKSLHKKYESIDSVLISVEEIDQAENKSLPEPDFDGWATRKPTKIKIKGYKYELALKIAAYLEKQGNTQSISSVLILGNAALVPPSYYFYADYTPPSGIDAVDAYTSWIPSDIFYSSPNLDLVMEWPVGRIPVDTNAEAVQVANKLEKWKNDWDKSWTDRYLYMGGNVTFDFRYLGEMYYLAFQQNGVFGDKPKLYFESSGDFTREKALDMFANENSVMMWLYSHGMGDGFYFPDEPLLAKDMLDLPYKKGLPLILSPSCMDGGFDYHLIDVPFDQSDELSIGEAIHKAPGAGIGYLGGARINLTGAEFSLGDQGKLNFGQSGYIPALLLEFLQAYQAGITRIGDAYMMAHNLFLEREGIQNIGDLAMYVNYVLLADPVMSLPAPQPFTLKPYSGLTLEGSVGVSDDNVPLFTEGTKNIAFKAAIPKESRNISLRVVDALKLETVVDNINISTNEKYVFSPATPSLYLIQSTSDSGTLVWQYFWVGDSQPLGSIPPRKPQ
jgi:hypothetical protein